MMNACMKISEIIQILIALLHMQKIVKKTMIPIDHVFACIVPFAVHILFLNRNLENIEKHGNIETLQIIATELEPLKKIGLL